jgi:hypothetical protein
MIRQLPEAGWDLIADALAYSPDGKLLASGHDDHVVRVWDPASGKLIHALHGHTSDVRAVAFSPSGLLASGSNGAMWLWDPRTGKEVWHVEMGRKADFHSLAFSPGGDTIAAACGFRTTRLWEVASAKEVARFAHEESAEAVAFSPDGTRVAAGGKDQVVLVWDVTAGQRQPRRPDEKALEALWADLASEDAARAYRAGWALAADAERSLPFLAARLRPLDGTTGRVARLIARLDADAFTEREAATVDLLMLGAHAEQALRKALADSHSTEVQVRAGRLLKAIDKGVISHAEVLRSVRAVAALQHIGTDESRKLLTRLAEGAEGAPQSRAARAALRRPEANPHH